MAFLFKHLMSYVINRNDNDIMTPSEGLVQTGKMQMFSQVTVSQFLKDSLWEKPGHRGKTCTRLSKHKHEQKHLRRKTKRRGQNCIASIKVASSLPKQVIPKLLNYATCNLELDQVNTYG